MLQRVFMVLVSDCEKVTNFSRKNPSRTIPAMLLPLMIGSDRIFVVVDIMILFTRMHRTLVDDHSKPEKKLRIHRVGNLDGSRMHIWHQWQKQVEYSVHSKPQKNPSATRPRKHEMHQSIKRSQSVKSICMPCLCIIILLYAAWKM